MYFDNVDKFSYFHSTRLDARLAKARFFYIKGKKEKLVSPDRFNKCKTRDLVSNYDKDSKETSVTQCPRFLQADSHRGPILLFSSLRRIGKSFIRFISNRLLIPIRLLEIFISIVTNRLWNICLNLNLFKRHEKRQRF